MSESPTKSASGGTKPYFRSTPEMEAYKEKALENLWGNYATFQGKADEWQKQYVNPAIGIVNERAVERPIAAASIAIFFALAFIPTMSFVLFCLGTMLVVGGSAAAFALFWVTVLVLGAASILLGTLVASAACTAFLVFWGLVSFASFRLVFCIYRTSSISHGCKAFDVEMRQLFFHAPKPHINGVKSE